MSHLNGLIAAVATPVDVDLQPMLVPLADHCRRLLDNGCDGINLLGTTGEATSYSRATRIKVMEGIADAGLPLDRFMVGTGAAALEDSALLTKRAMELGFSGALVLPPFYYKGLGDDALGTYFDALVERAGRQDATLYLYHFPQNTALPFSVDLIRGLRERHSDVFRGLKDSSGDMTGARAMAAALPGFDIFPSTEAALSEVAPDGSFAGVISASANLTAPIAGSVEDAVKLREALSSVPLVAAVKWAIGEVRGESFWARTMPPLLPLSEDEILMLQSALLMTEFGTAKAMLGD